MKALKVFASLVGLGISMPVNLYLFYRVLLAIDATNVMWLLWIAVIPVNLFVVVATKIAELSEAP